MVGGLRDRRPTGRNNVFWTFQAIWENVWKKSLNGHAYSGWGHATNRLDCQTTFVLDVSSDVGKISKKVAERSRDSGWGHADRRPTVKQRLFGRKSSLEGWPRKFWPKNSLNGHATVVGGHLRPSAS